MLKLVKDAYNSVIRPTLLAEVQLKLTMATVRGRSHLQSLSPDIIKVVDALYEDVSTLASKDITMEQDADFLYICYNDEIDLEIDTQGNLVLEIFGKTAYRIEGGKTYLFEFAVEEEHSLALGQ